MSNGPNAQVSVPATTQANGAALTKLAASAAIVKAVHALEWQRIAADDEPQRVCERGAHSDLCTSSSSSSMTFQFTFFLDYCCGSTSDGISCAAVADIGALVYLLWCTCRLPSSHSHAFPSHSRIPVQTKVVLVTTEIECDSSRGIVDVEQIHPRTNRK